MNMPQMGRLTNLSSLLPYGNGNIISFVCRDPNGPFGIQRNHQIFSVCSYFHWIGLRENLNRKPMGFYHQI